MTRLMGIDYGEARVGIALTDPLKIIASGYKTLSNDGSLYESIYSICLEKSVDGVIVGIPFNENSEIGPSAEKVLIFANKLNDYFTSQNFDIPFYEQDERYSTRDAIEVLREIKVKRKKKQKVIDQIAAAKILSDFMQSNNKIKLDLNK